jgi:hypothetical protein
MSKKHKFTQHNAQIRQIKRDIAINVPIILGCLTLTICAYLYDWHILAKVFLSFVSFMQLMHLPNLFTKLHGQKKKLAEVEVELET